LSPFPFFVFAGEISVEDAAKLLEEGRREIAASGDLAGLDQVRVRYLGKKGLLTELLKGLGKLPADQRPAAGSTARRIRATRPSRTGSVPVAILGLT
jgi:phenylalanyl-tRNA synthetase alpha subunit